MSKAFGAFLVMTLVCAASVRAADILSIGRATSKHGAAVEVPITLKDNSGTRLGSEGTPIQAIAFRVVADPKEAVRAMTFRRSGVLERLTPQFEHSMKSESSVSYLVAFSSTKARVAWRAGRDDSGDEIGRLVVELAPGLAPGTAIRLSIDPVTATLSNEGGTVSEQTTDGTLQLTDGAIVVP